MALIQKGAHDPLVLAPSDAPAERYCCLKEKYHGCGMCRGREAEVPHMVVDALRRTELRGCRRTSRHAQKALAMIRVRHA